VTPGRVQVTFDCSDPATLATFWAEVLGYPPPDIEGFRARLRSKGHSEDDLDNWCAIEDPTRARPRLFFQRVPEPKVVKNRVHLDVAARDGPGDRRQQIDAEVRRLMELGARRLRSVTDEDGYFVVLQDPEGNELCID
jgi:Glyoxalase-like domain